MKVISIIVPCYNEEKVVSIFYKEIEKLFQDELSPYQLELIFVNDGSRDNTHAEIIKLVQKDTRIQYINLARNFGKEAAMLAGLQHSSGTYITVMDVDLQDPPYLLIKMVDLLENDKCDIVLTRRSDRANEPLLRTLFSQFFYKLMKKASDVDMPQGVRDFRLMKRQVLDSILELKEYHRFSKGLFAWPGYRSEILEFPNVERVGGETSWSFWGLFSYAIEGVVAFTVFPLRIATITGILLFILSTFTSVFIIVRKLYLGDAVQGWTSMILIIIFFCSVQLIFLGIIGEYLSKIYEQIKGRPNYIIEKIYKS